MIKVYYTKNFPVDRKPPKSVSLGDYTEVATMATTDPEFIFERLNCGPLARDLKIRSMSVGDLLVLEDGTALYCAPNEFVSVVVRS